MGQIFSSFKEKDAEAAFIDFERKKKKKRQQKHTFHLLHSNFVFFFLAFAQTANRQSRRRLYTTR